MPTRQKLESALRNADKAGDYNAAKQLANALKGGQFDQDPPKEGGFFGASVIEPAATFLSGAVAEPAAGLVGLATLPFADAGKATENIEAVREAMTYIPKTPAGMASLKKIAGFLQPVGEALETVEKGAGDIAYRATDSSVMGALATASPAAALTALGIAPVRRALLLGKKAKPLAETRKAKKLLKKAAPEVDELKIEARKVYKQIDETGAVVKSDRTDKMISNIKSVIEKEGFDPDLHPKIAATLKRLEQIKGTDQPVGKIDTLRKIANSAASSLDPSEKRLGVKVIGMIDDVLDELKPGDFARGGGEVGSLYKDARQLWARTKRSQFLNEAFTKAQNQASGFENGIRVQFRSILNNKKKRSSFSPEEIKNMEKVVKGGVGENLAKLIGKFGFSEGQASSVLMGTIGVGAGAAIGGPIGAVAVPLIGQVSRKLAQRLTRGNAEFADAIVRAGRDGSKVVGEYIKHVPAKERSAKELSQLLLRPEVSIKMLRSLVKQVPEKQKSLVRDAIIYAELSQSVKSR